MFNIVPTKKIQSNVASLGQNSDTMLDIQDSGKPRPEKELHAITCI